MTKLKILLTGGSGFIGKNICESYLINKYEIIAPTRQKLDLTNDESIKNFFNNQYFDVVIHSATKPGHRNAADHSDLLLINNRMLSSLLHYQGHWAKLINTGSGAIYDMRYYKPKMKENYFGKNIPIDAHGYNKYLLGSKINSLQNVFDLRIFGIFGKYEDYTIRFISNNICKAIFDMPLTLKQNRKFDYLYINDLMPILEYFIDNTPYHKSYNITPDNAIELLDIANKINKISNKNLPIQIAENGFGLEYSGCNDLLKVELPNLKFTPIEDSITELYQWYLQNKNTINPQLLLKDK